MDQESWLDGIEQLAFKSELQKLADSPIYSEEKISEEEYDQEELPNTDEEDGFLYHSNDYTIMKNNNDAKNKIEQLKKKAKKKI
jgi:hypothetical protein